MHVGRSESIPSIPSIPSACQISEVRDRSLRQARRFKSVSPFRLVAPTMVCASIRLPLYGDPTDPLPTPMSTFCACICKTPKLEAMDPRLWRAPQSQATPYELHSTVALWYKEIVAEITTRQPRLLLL